MVEGPSGGNGRGAIGEILAVGTRAPGSGRIELAERAAPGEPTLRWRSRARTIEQIEAELTRIWAEPNLETMIDGRECRTRADFDAIGLTSRYHSSSILGFDWRVDGVAAGVLQTLQFTLRSGIGALQAVLALLNAVEERDLDLEFHVAGLP